MEIEEKSNKGKCKAGTLAVMVGLFYIVFYILNLTIAIMPVVLFHGFLVSTC